MEKIEQEEARNHPENDPGCGAESFAFENSPEKADDLPEHDDTVLHDWIEANSGEAVPPFQILSCFREEYNNR
ncbi:MAG: hypothetical protein IKE15_04210 [Clostridia bacterium]|nr:hypothetical protein [Clostridia bacterium]